MGKEKNSFIIHYSKAESIVNNFSDAEIGQMFKALVRYEISGEHTQFPDKAQDIVMQGIYYDLDNNRKKYVDTCARRSENQKKRWAQMRAREHETRAENFRSSEKSGQNTGDGMPIGDILKESVPEFTGMPEDMRRKYHLK